MNTISTPLLGTPHYRNARQALQKRVELMRDREALMKKVREFDAAIDAIDDVVIPEMTPGEDMYFGMLGPEGSYYTASLDKDGELRVVRARSAGTVKLPEPPPKAFDDMSDEEFEDMVAGVEAEVRRDVLRHPAARLVRVMDDDGSDVDLFDPASESRLAAIDASLVEIDQSVS